MSVSDYKNIMVYIECLEGAAVKVSLEMLTPARALAAQNGEKVIAVMIGEDCREAASQAAFYGADEIIVVKQTAYNADAYVDILKKLTEECKPSVFLLGATPAGKELAARLSAKLETGCVTDVTAMKVSEDGSAIFTCPVYGGTILNDIKINGTRSQIATIRSGAFKKTAVECADSVPIVEKEIVVSDDIIKARIIESVKEISEQINLEDAQVIVSGGRGMGNAENFALVKELADLLGGVVGATRPAIEAGWISRAHQVGQSGKIVSPRLYIACGISGATQHVSGMIGSDYIVAINKDEEAPIFEVANVGIVGNTAEVLPTMIEEIKKIKSAG